MESSGLDSAAPRREEVDPNDLRSAIRAASEADALPRQSLERPLRELITRTPVACSPETPLSDALRQMQEQGVGSMLVVDHEQRPVGIFTEHDLLERVVLAELAISAPIASVMTSPVHVLPCDRTALDAALFMSQYTIRHVPVADGAGRSIGMLSERDLFALQRLSLTHISATLRSAADQPALVQGARDIRQLAASLLAQGVQSRQLTALISHLNDLLTLRLLEIEAVRHGIELSGLAWIALGSEGRSEQTVSTDQDNGLVLADDTDDQTRAAILRFAHEVNLGLDLCGYPLCRGGIMAGLPACTLTLSQWQARFEHWIEHGAPKDLLDASIFFDFRTLAGDAALVRKLRDDITQRAKDAPRFIRQLAVNALAHGVPLSWAGKIVAGGDGTIDLKLQGTAVFVDAARVYSLAHGVEATSTRERLLAVGPLLGVAPAEHEAWVSAFEFLQMLRLRVQLSLQTASDRPNHLRIDTLNEIERRLLRECLRVARSLQQRLALDYQR
ncbi:MAG: DUF294 nucleotidyltransferase-like domain-containing protein [Pseudomonadota bacterium]